MEKYAETVEQLNQRGFDVFSFDWRGQGLSERLLKVHTLGHVTDYSQYLEDLAQIMRKVVMPRCRADIFLFGHSMGGHLALRYMAAQTDTPIAKMVLCAPMLDLHPRPLPIHWVRRFSGWMVRRGLGLLPVPVSIFNPYRLSFSLNCLTSDQFRFKRNANLLKSNPLLIIAGFSFSWLAATLDSLARLEHEYSQLPADLSILVVCAGSDAVVSNDKIAAFVAKNPQRRLAIIADAKHEILQERDELRNQFWTRFDEFMAA